MNKVQEECRRFATPFKIAASLFARAGTLLRKGMQRLSNNKALTNRTESNSALVVGPDPWVWDQELDGAELYRRAFNAGFISGEDGAPVVRQFRIALDNLVSQDITLGGFVVLGDSGGCRVLLLTDEEGPIEATIALLGCSLPGVSILVACKPGGRGLLETAPLGFAVRDALSQRVLQELVLLLDANPELAGEIITSGLAAYSVWCLEMVGRHPEARAAVLRLIGSLRIPSSAGPVRVADLRNPVFFSMNGSPHHLTLLSGELENEVIDLSRSNDELLLRLACQLRPEMTLIRADQVIAHYLFQRAPAAEGDLAAVTRTVQALLAEKGIEAEVALAGFRPALPFKVLENAADPQRRLIVYVNVNNDFVSALAARLAETPELQVSHRAAVIALLSIAFEEGTGRHLPDCPSAEALAAQALTASMRIPSPRTRAKSNGIAHVGGEQV